MEKIKASEILKLKPEITLEELKKFKLFGIEPFNKKILLFTHYPYSKPGRQQSPLGLESWEDPISIAVCDLYDRELGKSLREIDFSEEEDKEIIIKATGFLEIIKNAPNPFFRIEKERILFTSEEGIPVVEVAELVKQIIIKAELNYFAINKNGDMNLYSKKPTRSLAHVKWIAGGFCNVFFLGNRGETYKWDRTLRIIEFSEEIPKSPPQKYLDLQRITKELGLIENINNLTIDVGKLYPIDSMLEDKINEGFPFNHHVNPDIKSELQGGFHSEISSQDLIVNHNELVMPAQIDPPNHKDCPVRNLIVDKDVIGDSDVIYKNHDGSLTTTKPEPTRIFELDDIVHIMYGSDFGKSVLAKVVELLKTNLVRIKFENEMTMIIEERFLSFAPFSYEHGGFTQVRPMPEPKVGDYGFFYDEENPAFFCYGKLSKIHDIKEANYPYELKGILGLFYRYKYFSYTMPELAESVPVPNTTNQQ